MEYARMVKAYFSYRLGPSLIWKKYRSHSPSINPRLHSIQMSILIRTLRSVNIKQYFDDKQLCWIFFIQRFRSQQTKRFAFQIFKHQHKKSGKWRNFFLPSNSTRMKSSSTSLSTSIFYFIAKVLDFFQALENKP